MVTSGHAQFRNEAKTSSAGLKRTPPGPDDPLRIMLPSYRSHPFTGGQGVYMRHVSKALVDMGHLVDVVSGPPYPVLDPRVKLIKLPSLDLYAREMTRFGFPLPPLSEMNSLTDYREYMDHFTGNFGEPRSFGDRLYHYMKTRLHEYDVIHDNQTLSWGLVKLKNMGIPVAGTIHHPITMDRQIAIDAADSLKLNLLTRRWYHFLGMQMKVSKLLDPIIVVSESTKRDVSRDFGLAPETMELVYHGIDIEQWRAKPEIKREDNKLIAIASADVPLKGLIYLIEAYAMLLKERPELELTVIGTLREGLTKKRLLKLGILDKVKFVSGISDEEITDLYAKSTVAITPSVYEGFGYPAGEAMSSGMAVVSTTGGSLPEVVGDAGLLVPPKDPVALAGAIAKYLDNPGLREEMGRKARTRIETKFNWPRAAREVTAIYHRAIANANNGS